ncbi:36.4 kDa proline-rich protein-like [Salvia divinorum]|uniref:36.4 kDa proline-rich protein-like n=1 Tax=Salvia divinorum TaxID=28513 RepID=A0ABD1FJV4_SALDI
MLLIAFLVIFFFAGLGGGDVLDPQCGDCVAPPPPPAPLPPPLPSAPPPPLSPPPPVAPNSPGTRPGDDCPPTPPPPEPSAPPPPLPTAPPPPLPSAPPPPLPSAPPPPPVTPNSPGTRPGDDCPPTPPPPETSAPPPPLPTASPPPQPTAPPPPLPFAPPPPPVTLNSPGTRPGVDCPLPMPTCPVDIFTMSECLGKRPFGHLGCCPLIAGMPQLEAAVCVCNVLVKIKAFSLSLYVHLLLGCGKIPPEGFACI